MAQFNRFGAAPTKPKFEEDDEEELAAIAKKRMEPPPPKPVVSAVAPTQRASSARAPAAKTALPAAPKAQPKGFVNAVDPALQMRKEAIARLSKEAGQTQTSSSTFGGLPGTGPGQQPLPQLPQDGPPLHGTLPTKGGTVATDPNRALRDQIKRDNARKDAINRLKQADPQSEKTDPEPVADDGKGAKGVDTGEREYKDDRDGRRTSKDGTGPVVETERERNIRLAKQAKEAKEKRARELAGRDLDDADLDLTDPASDANNEDKDPVKHDDGNPFNDTYIPGGDDIDLTDPATDAIADDLTDPHNLEDGYDDEITGNVDPDLLDGDKEGDDELADIARERQAEQDAARDELKAGKAKALMMANARAQLAGMGLGGGTAALEGDISRTQDRGIALTMGELQRRQRDEGRDDRRLTAQERAAAANEKRAETNDAWQAIQRKMAIDQLEEESGVDYDGDDQIGGETPDETAETEADEAEAESDAKIAAAGAEVAAAFGGSGSKDDPIGGIGGAAEADLSNLTEAGLTFEGARFERGTFNGEHYIYCRGSDGKYYKFKAPGGALGFESAEREAKAWFAEVTGASFPSGAP